MAIEPDAGMWREPVRDLKRNGIDHKPPQPRVPRARIGHLLVM